MSTPDNTRQEAIDVLFTHSVDRPDQKTGGVVCECGWGPDGWFTYSEHLADALIAHGLLVNPAPDDDKLRVIPTTYTEAIMPNHRIESPHKYLGHDAHYWHEQMMIAAAKHVDGRCAVVPAPESEPSEDELWSIVMPLEQSHPGLFRNGWDGSWNENAGIIVRGINAWLAGRRSVAATKEQGGNE